jgi:ketosteroid isomerase-like protein
VATREVVQGYFDRVRGKHGWEALLSDDIQFTIYTSPVERVTIREAVLERLNRFYSMANAVDVKDILADGERACVLARYELQPPQGAVFESHVAEIFEVRRDQITSFDIYCDSAPFPK